MLKTSRSLAVLFGVLALWLTGPNFAVAATAGTGGTGSDKAPAVSWRAVVSDYDNAPSFWIAVDKASQQLMAFERQSPMRLLAKYPITTGKAVGDKLRVGDHKTPEGVYFVTGHITSGLNFTLYGKEAYPVNYPNPVDKLRKKTGSGIWLHGKGVPLSPRDTRGCVGMNNQDIAALGNKISIGQPVTMAAALEHESTPSPARAAEIARLEKLVYDWAKAWSDRSSRLFDFYDGEAYTLSGSGSFNAFRAQKERLFKTLAWVRTSVSDVQILEGPGYWVTWFNQDYRASNLSTDGTRRLYWQKDAKGNFRIVGMEWLPGLKSPVLLASRERAPALSESAPAKAPAKAQTPAATTSVAKTPAAQTPVARTPAGTTPGPLLAMADRKALDKPDLDANLAREGSKLVDAPKTQLEKSIGKPLPEPAPAPAPAKAETPAKPEKPAAPAKAETPAKPEKPAASAKPATPPARPEKPALPTLVASPRATSAQALQILEQWRSAWESGVVENYAKYYAPDATQGGRGRAQFLAQKKHGWLKTPPKRVIVENIQVTETANGFRLRFLQTYSNIAGYSDKGYKTLLLEQRGGKLLIVREDWTPIVN